MVLKNTFIGRGEVKGFEFTQLFATSSAFCYKVVSEHGSEHYEVFRHIVNKKYNCVSYPKSKSFGVWAWSFYSYDRSMVKFNSLNEPKQ